MLVRGVDSDGTAARRDRSYRSYAFLAIIVDVVLFWAAYFVGGHEHEGFGIAS